ncbi:MAG: DUF2071 domain-containing protein [Actinobacteria bacterium]|nr:DUF2071 domain-containing protein [Actinomycetota bacterium]
MKVPGLAGEIERRLLVNYRVDPDVIGRLLPSPFRPQLVNGFAVAGICLIRLGSMRPRWLPSAVGLRSENAAHRIAVEWNSPIGGRSGVYIPRRDSDSLVNVAVGGRLFPGAHHRANFQVTETPTELRVAFAARDGSAAVSVAVRLEEDLAGSELFADAESASAFFERGAVGFSATRRPDRFDGLALRTTAWRVQPATVLEARSTFFSDPVAFPDGSARLDCALVMRRVPVTWEALAPLRA